MTAGGSIEITGLMQTRVTIPVPSGVMTLLFGAADSAEGEECVSVSFMRFPDAQGERKRQIRKFRPIEFAEFLSAVLTSERPNA